jgi:CHAD domain-containing protein
MEAGKVIQERIAAVRKHEAGVLRGDPDSVHDMRVATRRLRAALRIFKLSDRKLKRLQDALGAVRDVHVQADWLAKEPSCAALYARLLSEMQADAGTLRGEILRWRSETIPGLKRACADAKSPRRSKARKQLAKSIARVEASCSAFRRSQEATVAHRLRINAKKLRYDLELLDEDSALLKQLIPLQQGLGDLHDADVRIELLAREGLRKLATRERTRRRKLAQRAKAPVARWRAALESRL